MKIIRIIKCICTFGVHPHEIRINMKHELNRRQLIKAIAAGGVLSQLGSLSALAIQGKRLYIIDKTVTASTELARR